MPGLPRYGTTNTTSKSRSTSFTVPNWCGPLGYCYGGKTWTASGGKTQVRGGD